MGPVNGRASGQQEGCRVLGGAVNGIALRPGRGGSEGWWCRCGSRCGVLVGVGVGVGIASVGVLCVVGLGSCCMVGVVARLSKGDMLMVVGVGSPMLHGGLLLTDDVYTGAGWLAVEPVIHETFPRGPRGGGGPVFVDSSGEGRVPRGGVGRGPVFPECRDPPEDAKRAKCIPSELHQQGSRWNSSTQNGVRRRIRGLCAWCMGNEVHIENATASLSRCHSVHERSYKGGHGCYSAKRCSHLMAFSVAALSAPSFGVVGRGICHCHWKRTIHASCPPTTWGRSSRIMGGGGW